MSRATWKYLVHFFLFLSITAILVQRSVCSGGKKHVEYHQKTVGSPSQSNSTQLHSRQNIYKKESKFNSLKHFKNASGTKHHRNSIKNKPDHHSHKNHMNMKDDHQDKLATTTERESIQPPMVFTLPHYKNRSSTRKQHMTPAAKNNHHTDKEVANNYHMEQTVHRHKMKPPSHNQHTKKTFKSQHSKESTSYSHPYRVENEKQASKALESSRKEAVESMLNSADKVTSEIVSDTEKDDISEEHEGSGKQLGELQKFQMMKNGCYSSLSRKLVKEGEFDIHPPSCLICECLHNKLYCTRYC